jgi:hypothetical protein
MVLSQHFQINNLCILSYFLGLHISSSCDGYYLTQAKYTSYILLRANLIDNKIVDTPIQLNAHLNPRDGEPICDLTLY